jgi:phosphate-selective porin OprO/OprP
MRKHVASLLTALGCIAAAAASARADDAALLDVLRQKQVLTPQEYERLKGSELTPAQRSGLIDVLRDKGVLTREEVDRLQPVAETPPAASPQAPAVVEAPKPPVPQAGYEDGFFVRSADGNLSLRLNGRVAVNSFFFAPNTTLVDTFTIDRARLSADAAAYRYFRMRLEYDFAFSNGLRDAYIAFMPAPWFNAQFGQYKVPFGYEELLSKKYIDFVERAVVTAVSVAPSRDIGLMASGQVADQMVRYQLAVMNGAGQNRADNNSDKDIVARLVVAPFVSGPPHLRGFNVGGAVTFGHEPAQTFTGSQLSTSSVGGILPNGFTFANPVSVRGDRTRAAWHAAWLDGPFSVSSEYITTDQARDGYGVNGADLPALDTDGAYVGGTWLLTGETKPFNARIRPAHPLWAGDSPGWGAWEAALRYEYFKLRKGAGVFANGTSDPELDDRFDALVTGVNWYPNDLLRFSLNYMYSTVEGVAPNTAKHSVNAVLGRAQMEF